MKPEKKAAAEKKTGLHHRNKNGERYNFVKLIGCCPELSRFVTLNKYGVESINFANPSAVKELNKALLKYHYGIEYWEIPPNYLCPPIPGRADYIHHIADLVGRYNNGEIPYGEKIKCLDVGVGANCIYPIIGHTEYEWSFVGSDIDLLAINSAKKIIASNPSITGKIELRQQADSKNIFLGVIKDNERFDLTVCNPPFHSSIEKANAGTMRKLNNLSGERANKPILNFGGQKHELCYEGGEEKFLLRMVRQSKYFAGSCFWYSSLVSKESSLKHIYRELKKVGAVEIETIPIGHGNKTSRIVAWTFLQKETQKRWKNERLS